MKIEITKEWCLRMAQVEANAEIGAGLYALDPIFDGETMPADEKNEEPSIAFGRFVRLMRRDRGLTLEKLAEDTDVEISELVEIEDDTRHKPELRTVYQLANYFKVPRANLLQVAGLTALKDSHLIEEAVRFAARSESVAVLTSEERAALEAFVAVLSEQK
jgi:HTH-type transcriptional regulator, competence development regulator